jgi:hypothetical protein
MRERERGDSPAARDAGWVGEVQPKYATVACGTRARVLSGAVFMARKPSGGSRRGWRRRCRRIRGMFEAWVLHREPHKVQSAARG